MTIPRHIAIIMDGNGRWAEKRHLPRVIGHQRGVDVVQKVVTECRHLGVGCLTLYAFSSENWKRPEEEVAALMGLLGRYLRSELSVLLDQGIRLRVIGEMDRLPGEIRKVLNETMARTADHDGMILTLALSYGGRNEMVRAFGKLAAAVQEGQVLPAQIDEAMIANALDTAGLPDPDLLIRTSGEMRISNFLLWQLAYTELYFTKVLWPDFTLEELQRAISVYSQRQRRFGLTGAQLADGPGPRGEEHH